MNLPSRRLFVLVSVLLAAVAVLLLGACESGDGGSGDLASDQTIRVWLDGEPDYIDPSIADFATAVAVSKNVFATLLRYDPTTDEVLPYVASEVPTVENGGISEDGLTYTFRLREDAVWEDGQPIRAQDFVYSLQRLMDPRVGSYYGNTYYFEIIEGGIDLAMAVEADEATIEDLRGAVAAQAVDDHTLEVKITRPSTTFNLLMALWPTAALRQDVIEAHGDIANTAWTEPGNLVASGPFRLAEWTHGSSIVLERNPNFWDEEMTPVLDRIVFRIIEDQNTAFSAYLRGDLDAVPVPVADLRRISDDPQYGDELRRVPMVVTFGFAYNHAKSPFDTVEARKAFCQSVDRGTFVNEVQQGLGVPTTSWLPPALEPYYEADRGSDLSFNPETALSVVSSSNRPALPSVSFTYANVDPNGIRGEFLQGQWKEHLGLDVRLVPLDSAAFGQAFGTGDFDMLLIGFGEDYHHPENWLMLWRSDGGLSTAGYSNPEFDRVVDEALTADDPGEAVALWQEAERILLDEDAALCPLFNDENAWLVKPHVEDFIMTGADGLPGDFFYWKTHVLER